jgi:hypothetical protein
MKKSTGDKRGGTDDNKDPVFAFHAATLTAERRLGAVSGTNVGRSLERPTFQTSD